MCSTVMHFTFELVGAVHVCANEFIFFIALRDPSLTENHLNSLLCLVAHKISPDLVNQIKHYNLYFFAPVYSLELNNL